MRDTSLVLFRSPVVKTPMGVRVLINSFENLHCHSLAESCSLTA